MSVAEHSPGVGSEANRCAGVVQRLKPDCAVPKRSLWIRTLFDRRQYFSGFMTRPCTRIIPVLR